MNHKRLRDIAGVTHVGRRRRTNEDTMAWDNQLGLALVADGVGGHNGGEVASLTAARSIQADLRIAMQVDAAPDSAERRTALVHELVRRANQRVRTAAGRSRELAGMGTTLALALLGDEYATVANVGDSRVYRMRAGKLECLTKDHFAFAELVERGHVTTEEMSRSNMRNVLSRALGMPGEVAPDLTHQRLEPDDLFLLCSDGLTTAANDEEIGELMRTVGPNLRDAAERAVDLANKRGGRDNVSVILMRIA
jgi:serine/threonine protein phosphatase PrpC